jgi:hypothetical protein
MYRYRRDRSKNRLTPLTRLRSRKKLQKLAGEWMEENNLTVMNQTSFPQGTMAEQPPPDGNPDDERQGGSPPFPAGLVGTFLSRLPMSLLVLVRISSPFNLLPPSAPLALLCCQVNSC